MDYQRYDLRRILITGSRGNIGKIICSDFKEKKIDFFITPCRKKTSFSLTNKKLTKLFLNKLNPTLIIHCAVDNKIKPDLSKNLKMLQNLINYDSCPIIYLSSVAVYDGINSKILSESQKIFKFTNQYSLVKKKCEDRLLSRKFKGDLCLRIPGIFGQKRINGIMYQFKKSLYSNTKVINYFNLNKQWQCLHEQHFKFYIEKILYNKQIKPKILNVGYEGKVSLERAYKIFLKKLKKNNVENNLKNKTIETKLNLNKLKKITNGKIFKLEDGIKLYLQ